MSAGSRDALVEDGEERGYADPILDVIRYNAGASDGECGLDKMGWNWIWWLEG